MNEDLNTLLIGINRIFYEASSNYLAYYSIDWNKHRDAGTELPTALYMLLKIHYHAYIVEISKILLGGDNHFHINKALKVISGDKKFTETSRQLRGELARFSGTIGSIRDARNTLFAHLDENYKNFKISLDSHSTKTLNQLLGKIIDFLNNAADLEPFFDYRHFEDVKISEFYDLIYTNIVNTNSVTSLYASTIKQ